MVFNIFTWTIMLLVYPPPPQKKRKNICITIVFDFFWDHCNIQEELETMIMPKQDALWPMCKERIVEKGL